ncbi:MAG: SDR family NAD(P)-dependent oxidoreductase [Bdellovibrionota bacterium]
MSWVLITGATSGIGLATAQLLATRSYKLILLGRRKDRLDSLQKELSPKTEIKTFDFDLRDTTQIQGFLMAQKSLLNEVQILINNAGLARGADKIQDSNLEDIDEMIETNLTALLHLTRGLLPHLLKRGQGHIVNMGSVAGRIVYPKGAVYCATKFAVRAISDGLRMDLLGTPIRVTNIEPGMVNTEFSEVRLNSKEKADQVYQNMNPLTAQDIAETILWCLERPAHVNIQELVIYPTDQASVGQVHRR